MDHPQDPHGHPTRKPGRRARRRARAAALAALGEEPPTVPITPLSVSQNADGDEMKLVVTYQRGMGGFCEREVEQRLDATGIIPLQGKVVFCTNKTSLSELVALKTVERVFVLGCIAQPPPEAPTVVDDIPLFVDFVADSVDWTRCMELWRLHNTQFSGDGIPMFRIVTKRSGLWGSGVCTSLDLDRALAIRLVQKLGWEPELVKYDMEITVHISEEKLMVMFPLCESLASRQGTYVSFGLRPAVAYGLLQAAEVTNGMIVLDPMCGKGTILVEGASSFHNSFFIGVDTSKKQLRLCCANANAFNITGRTAIMYGDAQALPLADRSVDAIVCDLPFGRKYYIKGETQKVMYPRLIKEFWRVLKPGSHMVLLSAPTPALEQAMKTEECRGMFDFKIVHGFSLGALRSTAFVYVRRT